MRSERDDVHESADGREPLDPLAFDDLEDEGEGWDTDDPRRRHDQMAPPQEPCECYCLHCGRTFSSDGIWFQKVVNDPAGFEGFWMCPTPNCSGAGFTFDIFPTDPAHPANAGWHCFDDDDDDDGDDEDGGLEGCESEYQLSEVFDVLPDAAAADESEWDPDEPTYKALDGMECFDDEDMEGEEWKYGLAPGERPEFTSEAGRREWDEEQRRYEQPDERPRELDWSDRTDRHPRPDYGDDDIPF